MKILKRLMWLIILLPVALIALIVILFLAVDPNTLKPVLRDAAADQGIELELPGDLGWKFWPSVGFSLGQLSMRQAGSDEPLLGASNASVSVQLMPLFKRKILVDGIDVEDATVNLLVDHDGVNNWSKIGSPAETDAAPETTDTTTTAAELSVARVRFANTTLTYRDLQNDQDIRVSRMNIEARDVAIDGHPFPVDLSLDAQIDQLPPVTLELDGEISLDLDRQQFTTDKTQVRVTSSDADARLTLTTQTHWGESLSSTGMLHMTPTNLRRWLAIASEEPLDTRNPDALSSFSLNLPYEYRDETLALPDINIQLDSTVVKGSTTLGLGETISVKSDLRGTSINVDDYLPPASEADDASVPEAEPTPLPMELLRDLWVESGLTFEEITIMDISLKNLQLGLSAQNGLLHLQPLQAGVAGGQIAGEGQLDARKAVARLTMELAGENIDVGQLLQQVADFDDIQGKVQTQIQVVSEGTTDRQLSDNLHAAAKVQSAQMQWQKVNLEQQFCRAMAILQQSEPPAFDWPPHTTMQPIEMNLVFAQQTIKVENLKASLARLLANAQGSMNIETGDFNFPFNLSLGNFANSAAGDADETIAGCLPIQEKWRNRALPIRCKGNIDNVGAKTCLPDVKLLTDLAKDRAKEKIDAKVQEKRAEVEQKVDAKQDEVEQELEDKAKDLLRDKLGDEKGKSVEESARDALRRLRSN